MIKEKIVKELLDDLQSIVEWWKKVYSNVRLCLPLIGKSPEEAMKKELT